MRAYRRHTRTHTYTAHFTDGCSGAVRDTGEGYIRAHRACVESNICAVLRAECGKTPSSLLENLHLYEILNFSNTKSNSIEKAEERERERKKIYSVSFKV